MTTEAPDPRGLVAVDVAAGTLREPVRSGLPKASGMHAPKGEPR
jgi:hypothetical protein